MVKPRKANCFLLKISLTPKKQENNNFINSMLITISDQKCYKTLSILPLYYLTVDLYFYSKNTTSYFRSISSVIFLFLISGFFFKKFSNEQLIIEPMSAVENLTAEDELLFSPLPPLSLMLLPSELR